MRFTGMQGVVGLLAPVRGNFGRGSCTGSGNYHCGGECTQSGSGRSPCNGMGQ